MESTTTDMANKDSSSKTNDRNISTKNQDTTIISDDKKASIANQGDPTTADDEDTSMPSPLSEAAGLSLLDLPNEVIQNIFLATLREPIHDTSTGHKRFRSTAASLLLTSRAVRSNVIPVLATLRRDFSTLPKYPNTDEGLLMASHMTRFRMYLLSLEWIIRTGGHVGIEELPKKGSEDRVLSKRSAKQKQFEDQRVRRNHFCVKRRLDIVAETERTGAGAGGSGGGGFQLAQEVNPVGADPPGSPR